jgi:galactitol-specific phosphotransferase system IIB component
VLPENQLEQLVRNANIPARYESCSFENLNAITPKLDLVKTWRNVSSRITPSSTAVAGPGALRVGKTHLAVSILKDSSTSMDRLPSSMISTTS